MTNHADVIDIHTRRPRHQGLFDIPEAAEYLRVSRTWIEAAVRERRLAYVKLGRLVRFRLEHLDALIDAGEVPAVSGD